MPGLSEGSHAVSAVIVNWNAGSLIEECVQSLLDGVRRPAEIIVVDNASSDGSADAVASRFPTVQLIRNADNRGLAAANNQGIRAATGDHVLVSNPDVVYHPGAVAALLDVLDRRSRAAIAIPRLNFPDGRLQTSAGDLPTVREALLGRQWIRRTGAEQGFWWDAWPHDEERRVGRGETCAYLVRRTAVAEVGLQDERFFLDWEGIDWMARMADAGWEVWFTPDARVVHVGGVSMRQATRRWIVGSHVGIYRYFAKRRPAWRPLLLPAVVARAGVKMVAARLGRAKYERGQGSAG